MLFLILSFIPLLGVLVWYIVYRCKMNKLDKAVKKQNEIKDTIKALKGNDSNYNEVYSMGYYHKVLKKDIDDQITQLNNEYDSIDKQCKPYNVGFCHWAWCVGLLTLGVVFATIFANIHFEWKVNELEQERESLIYQATQLKNTTYDLTNNKYRESLVNQIKDYNIRVYNATYCKNDFIFGIFYDVNYSYVSQIDYGDLL